jgi:chemotaxis protein CheX
MPSNEDFIKPFVESAQNVLSTMLGMEAAWSKTYPKTSNEVFGEVSGIMGMAEGGAEGLIVASFPVSLALKIGGGFLGMEVAELDSDVKESIGELVNMIAGGAKAKLEGTPYFFLLSIPTVVSGKGVEIHHKSSHLRVVAELTVADETFVIEVSMKVG